MKAIVFAALVPCTSVMLLTESGSALPQGLPRKSQSGARLDERNYPDPPSEHDTVGSVERLMITSPVDHAAAKNSRGGESQLDKRHYPDLPIKNVSLPYAEKLFLVPPILNPPAGEQAQDGSDQTKVVLAGTGNSQGDEAIWLSAAIQIYRSRTALLIVPRSSSFVLLSASSKIAR